MKKFIFLFFVVLLVSPVFSANSTIFGVRQITDGYMGVAATLTVEVEAGENHVFIDTMPLTEIDTQTSARLAREVACETLAMDCSTYDFFYIIRGNFPMVGGPSAGAAMTVLTMSELIDVVPFDNVAMTGTVNPDGSVGPIGGVLEKAITASENGITVFLIPHGQISEIGNYTFDNGMTVVEVSTIRQAFTYFTDYTFETIDDEIDFEQFNDFMSEMSNELIVYSDDLFSSLSSMINITELNVEDESIISTLYNQTFVQKEEMMSLYHNNSFYSAASYAVGSSILSLYATYVLNYFTSSNQTEYINSLFNLVNNYADEIEILVSQTTEIDNINDIEAINIATDRFFEAKEILEQATSYYQNDDYINTLYNIAFTYVRLKTAESWIGLLDSFSDSSSFIFEQESLQELALQRLDEARTMITYSESLGYYGYTVEANNHLETSEEAYLEGNFIYSIFESLKALSNANLDIQLSGLDIDTIDERIKLSKQLARENINSAQSYGLTPILALSYYEYSQSFEESSSAQAMVFLEYSKQFARLSTQMVHSITGSYLTESISTITAPEDIGLQLLSIVFGIVIGLSLVLLLVFKVMSK